MSEERKVYTLEEFIREFGTSEKQDELKTLAEQVSEILNRS